MKTEIYEPKPSAVLKHRNDVTTEIYVLDEKDSMAMNSSSNYDYHYEGPGIVIITRSNGMIFKDEHFVNDPDLWLWFEALMRLGLEYLKEFKGFDFGTYKSNLKDIIEKRKPYTSSFKKIADKGKNL